LRSVVSGVDPRPKAPVVPGGRCQAGTPKAQAGSSLPNAIRHWWASRELERQIGTGTALGCAVSTKKVSPVVNPIHPAAADEFLHRLADAEAALKRRLGRSASDTTKVSALIDRYAEVNH